MTLDALIARLTQLEQKATPGPWKCEFDSCDCGNGMCSHGSWTYGIKATNLGAYVQGGVEDVALSCEDGELVSALRNEALPALLAVRQEIEELVDALTYAIGMGSVAQCDCSECGRIRDILAKYDSD